MKSLVLLILALVASVSSHFLHLREWSHEFSGDKKALATKGLENKEEIKNNNVKKIGGIIDPKLNAKLGKIMDPFKSSDIKRVAAAAAH